MGPVGAFSFDCKTSHLHNLMKWLAKEHTDKIILSYPNTEGEYNVNLTGRDIERVTAYTASLYRDAFKQLPKGEVTGDIGFGDLPTVIVAIISTSTVASYMTFLAMHRLGLTPILVSPRLADDGYAHLLRTTGCHTAIAAGAPLDALRRIKKTYDGTLDVVPMPSDDEVIAGREHTVDLPDPNARPGFIIHTGGTTGMPKPVPFHVDSWLLSMPPEVSNTFEARILSTVPNVHAFGIGNLMRCLRSGLHLYLLNADRPVTAGIIRKVLDDHQVPQLNTVPYVMKFFADMEGGVERLAKLDLVMLAGAATPDDLVELMLKGGVNLRTAYGQTESGATMAQSGAGVEDWNWMTPLPHTAGKLEFEKVGDDMYHLVVKAGCPGLKMSDRPDGSYGTKDLFRPHPDNQPGSDTRVMKARWKFLGRQGDIIVLVNGENADPTPIEAKVMNSPLVEIAMAFGAGHERLGLLVIASEKAADMSKEELVEAITPELESGNALASDYARISPDDVLVLPAGTEYPMTAKMTLQRPIFHKMFAADIEAHYEARDRASGAGKELSDDEVVNAVRRVVVEEQERQHDSVEEFDDDTDFFSMGMDSLMSSLVRRRLLREIPLPEGAKLTTNVVFEYPTVNRLTEHLQNLRLEKAQEGLSARNPETIAAAMVKKYVDLVTAGDGSVASKEANGANGKSASDKKHVVVLTGATGYLGAQLVKLLVERADVSRVYCPVRTRQARDHKNASERILTSLANSSLLEGISEENKSKLVCLSSNLAVADLGLSPTEYSEIQASVTAVIHNAWSVNFNMNLESFEPNVASVAHLLNLSKATASSTQAKRAFIFISSIAAAMGVVNPGSLSAEERMYEWTQANPVGGYGQSKWVAEHICAQVAASTKTTGFGSVRILRVGQVSGDTKNGIWNPAEAIPAIVQSALTVGALPKMEGDRNTLCWLPSDTTAATIVDLTMAERGPLSVFHVASPHTLTWNDVVLPAIAKAGIEARVVPQEEWVRILDESDADIERNPPYKLIEHFRKTYGKKQGVEADANGTKSSPEKPAGMVKLGLANSMEVSPSLKAAAPVDCALVEKYVRFWMKYWAGEHHSSPRA